MSEIEKFSIIGKGTFGVVIHPAILCSEMSNDKEHYVSKILPIKQAEKEITLLNKMPKELNGILYFTENSYCIVDETNKQIPEKLGINSKNSAYVNMVYLPGLELNDYLDQYKTEENQTNKWHDKYEIRDEIPEIPREIILELLTGLSKFYPKVISLNDDYHYYHNDISSTNIMNSKNEFYLIDFGRSSDKPISPNCDIFGVIDTFNTILLTIPYMTNNEDLKLIYKTYNDELDAFNKIRPQVKEKIVEFKKTLFEKTLNKFINPSINEPNKTNRTNEISGGKKTRIKRKKNITQKMRKRNSKKHL
jgi:hypothetical protein